MCFKAKLLGRVVKAGELAGKQSLQGVSSVPTPKLGQVLHQPLLALPTALSQ